MTTTRAALIGCGNMGRGHALLAPKLGIELVALCDNVDAAAQRLQQEIGVGAVTNVERVMENDGIELVIIATHHDAHHPLALAAAAAGKHMLVEKPLCLRYEQAVEVAEAVEQAGVKLVINCKFRINPTVQKVRQLLPRPRISHGQLAMDTTGASRPRGGWIWHPDDGGGLLISTAVHTVDLLAYVMNSRAERVYAEGRVFGDDKGETGSPDGLTGTIAWEGGGISTVISCDQGFSPSLGKWFCNFMDGERTATLTDHVNRADFGGCELDYLDATELPEQELVQHTMLANLLAAIRTGGDTLCDARAGAHAVAICNALEESARTGTPVDVRRD